jgi:hypothetical protein
MVYYVSIGFRVFVELQLGNKFDQAYYFTSYWFQGLMLFEFSIFRFFNSRLVNEYFQTLKVLKDYWL